jgi:aspartokinase
MTTESKSLDFISKLGEASPPPIRLSRLFQSREQDFFSFGTPEDKPAVLAEVFEALGRSMVNIRFINHFTAENGRFNVQFCIDSAFREIAANLFSSPEIAKRIHGFQHVADAVILSLYPFQGRPQVAERALSELERLGARILGVNCGASVLSCVIESPEPDSVVEGFKQAFIIG